MRAVVNYGRMAEHAPENAMAEPGEIARFYDRCSDLMRELLEELAALPDRPRPFPAIEDALGWPHRRIASVLGGVCHLRCTEFAGRRPYRFNEPGGAASRRWEMWMDADQARAVRAEQSGAEEDRVYSVQKCPTCAAAREVTTGSGAIDSATPSPPSAAIVATTHSASVAGS